MVGFADDGVYVQFSNGDSFQPKTLVLSDFGYNNSWISNNLTPRCLGNVKNLFGGADIIGFKSDGVYISTFSNGAFSAPTLVLSGQYGTASGWNSFDQYPRLCADMDGDGRTDIVGFGNSTYISYAQSDGTFSLTPETTTQMSSGFASFDLNPRFFLNYALIIEYFLLLELLVEFKQSLCLEV